MIIQAYHSLGNDHTLLGIVFTAIQVTSQVLSDQEQEENLDKFRARLLYLYHINIENESSEIR